MDKHTQLIVKFLLLTASFGLSVGVVADDITASDYSSINLLGVEAAYKQKITGEGVGVAVVDSPVHADHPWLKGHIYLVENRVNDEYTEEEQAGFSHGTAVAGVVGGRRGIAPGSTIYGLGIREELSTVKLGAKEFLKIMRRMPDVRIYNNSFGTYVASTEEPISKFLNFNSWHANDHYLNAYIEQSDKIVAVFTAGNEGFGDTNGFSALPYYYYKPTITNFINVTSFNPHVIVRDQGGRLVLPPAAVSIFTNLAGKTALWSVMAPGTDVKVPSLQKDGYMVISGTSFAAPAVSGALALVQQKYPWMSARQLADAVLSTANHNFASPDYVVQINICGMDGDNVNKLIISSFNDSGEDRFKLSRYSPGMERIAIKYFDSHPKQKQALSCNGDLDNWFRTEDFNYIVNSITREEAVELGLLNDDELNGTVALDYVARIIKGIDNPLPAKIEIGILNDNMQVPVTLEQVKKIITEHFNAYPQDWQKYSLENIDIDLTNLDSIFAFLEKEDSWHARRVTFEEVFGQGLLDISKAINGPARLDANRLSETDIIDLPELGVKAVLDTFNTKGYTAFFDNDITERRWMDHYVHPDLRTTGSNGDRARALNGLSVGLRKAGQGTLVLRGENSYTGLTVVDEGTLVITPREDGSGGKLLNSTAVVNKQGTLSGNGFIKNIVNHGTVKPIGILKTKNYTQGSDGILHIGFGPTGSSSIETDTAKLAGILLLEPSPIFYSSADALELDVVTGQIVGNFENIQVTNPSPTLTFNATSYGGKVRAKTCSLHSMYFNRSSPRRLAITITRPLDAYAKFAKDDNAKRVGESLVEMTSNEPSSEIKELITRLDWHTTPAEIGNMLHALSPESYDAASFIMLKQQKELTKELFSNLGHKAFVLPIVSSMHYAGKVSSYTSDNAGVLIAGGKKLGAYLGLMGSRSRLDHADFNTASVNFGSYALLFDHLKFQAGATVSSSSMKRSSYETTRSHWTESGFNLAFALDKKYQLNNRLTLTPFGETSFNLTHRPSLSEKDGSYMNLMLASSNNKSLNSTLGVKVDIKLPKDFALILVTAWQHEYLDPAMRTQATALGFTPANFYSLTKLMDRDSLLIGGGIKLTRKNLQAKLGFTSERSRTGHINTLRMGLGWRF